ncbi:S-layer homology domain-containing protein [Bacillus infantis]|uniref:S-layer homology domain-containing protein n=1 Tax=Bacillus infantis TaxID=324767 RepID=UPI001CD27E47|nr:S-layer homology domain-containing protein [Bacillus infantis]MCA1041627.1 S-layer homology domain-containing protein [Bacillus infantis]
MNKKTGFRKKLASVLLILTMLFSSIGLSSANAASDIKGHWASKEITLWVQKGLMKGYEDGSFKPNKGITRAEFAALVNRTFDFKEKSARTYSDIKNSAWYKTEVQKADAAGYMTGYEDGSFRPNQSISRQEVAAVLSRIYELEPNSKEASRYKDRFAAWSQNHIGAVSALGYMTGYPDGYFQSAKPITRAEAVVTLDRSQASIHTYGTAGTFGPDKGTQTLKGHIIIDSKDVKLQNLVVEGNLTISKMVGEGDATLQNVTVKGKTFINGGGENSIHVIDSQLNKVIISKAGSPVRVAAEGTTSINEVLIRSAVKLDAANQKNVSVKSIVIDAPAHIAINLTGEFDQVTVNSKDAVINVPAGSKVKNLSVNAASSFTGEGTIEKAFLNSKGTVFEKQPAEVVENGVTKPGSPGTNTGTSPGGTVVQPAPSPSPGGGNSGEIVISSIADIQKTVNIGESYTLPSKVEAVMSDGKKKQVDIIWDGTAYTEDVGTYQYNGAVEGYRTAVKLTLNVTLTGYSENEDGTVAYVENAAALKQAQSVITVDEVEVKASLQLPEGFQKDIKIPAGTENRVIDLNGLTLSKVTVNGKNMTLKNGTIEEIVYGNDIESITLENIRDESYSVHKIEGKVSTISLKGSTDISGLLRIETSTSTVIEAEGTAKVSGTININTTEQVTISTPAETVTVDTAGAIVVVKAAIVNMAVRYNAAVQVDAEGSIQNPIKRPGVVVTENNQVSAAQFRTASTLVFAEDLDFIDLDRYIQVATILKNGADIGNQDNQFPQSAVDDLDAAISTAEQAKNNIDKEATDKNAEQQKIDMISGALKSELETFGSKRIFVDTSDFRSYLRAMEQLLARSSIGDTLGHVPEGAYRTFEQAVTDAKTALKIGLTTESSAAEKRKLEEAENAFREAYLELPFFDEDSSTIEGSVNFVPPAGEVFTDFPIFKIENKETGYYEHTGWAIRTGDTNEGWSTMEVTALNSSRMDLNSAAVVYYTVPTDKHIYTGSFSVADFKSGSSKTLVAKQEVTGALEIQIPFAGSSFITSNIVISDGKGFEEEKWYGSMNIAETTAIPLGSYKVEVYGYDNQHEYILEKKDVNIAAGSNQIVYLESSVDTVSLTFENFTGWDIKPSAYTGEGSNLRYSRGIYEEDRELHSALKISKTFGNMYIEYYANHSERDNEQWRYRVNVPRSAGDQTIVTSPHFAFKPNIEGPITVQSSEDKLWNYLDVSVQNDLGQRLEDLYFNYEGAFRQYGGEITVKSGGQQKSKKIENLWRFADVSIEEIFPGATGEVEVTFSLEDTPFIIPNKSIRVKIGN